MSTFIIYVLDLGIGLVEVYRPLNKLFYNCCIYLGTEGKKIIQFYEWSILFLALSWSASCMYSRKVYYEVMYVDFELSFDIIVSY